MKTHGVTNDNFRSHAKLRAADRSLVRHLFTIMQSSKLKLKTKRVKVDTVVGSDSAMGGVRGVSTPATTPPLSSVKGDQSGGTGGETRGDTNWLHCTSVKGAAKSQPAIELQPRLPGQNAQLLVSLPSLHRWHSPSVHAAPAPTLPDTCVRLVTTRPRRAASSCNSRPSTPPFPAHASWRQACTT